MANHDIPRTAKVIEDVFGVADDGSLVRVRVYEHTRQGHLWPMWFVLQSREVDRQMDRRTRRTQQFSGDGAWLRLDAEMSETRALLAESRERAARQGAR